MTTEAVFVPDDEQVWRAAEIIARDGATVTVRGEDGVIATVTLQSASEQLPLQDARAPAEGVDDLSKLDALHEAAVLHNLKVGVAVAFKCFEGTVWFELRATDFSLHRTPGAVRVRRSVHARGTHARGDQSVPGARVR